MMKKALVIASMLMAFGAAGLCGEPSAISLTDGNTLFGEVVAFDNGVYTVRTDSLGTVRIPASKIASIRPGMDNKGLDSIRAVDPLVPPVEALGQKMMSDQEIMNIIYSLANDPEFQAILADTAVMSAVAAGDVQALLNNPKFIKLLSNPKVKKIQEKTIRKGMVPGSP